MSQRFNDRVKELVDKNYIVVATVSQKGGTPPLSLLCLHLIYLASLVSSLVSVVGHDDTIIMLGGFMEQVRKLAPRERFFTLTASNRDAMVDTIYQSLTSLL